MASVDVVSGFRREVDECQLDALTRADCYCPRAIGPTVAERLSVITGQVTADVFVVFSVSVTVVGVGDQLGLSEG